MVWAETVTVVPYIRIETSGNVAVTGTPTSDPTGVAAASMVLVIDRLAGGVTVTPLDRYGVICTVCVIVLDRTVGTAKTVRAEE